MRKTIGRLTPAFLTAVMLTTVTGAANADSAPTLDLWSRPFQSGDLEQVSVPEQEGCVPLEEPFRTRSAYNRSDRFAAELYVSGDCTGAPAATVGKNRRPNFLRGREVASVHFTES
ncbi:hypothetical protein GCM10017673_10520 [Streptosporangium violaceochromogenes]|nr:hypothetical protein GCM10017673_10520 [Streptosporangium violaceochromogenes]